MNIDSLIPPLDERSQLEVGTKLEKEHFTKSGKPKDKTPRAVAKTHLGENPKYYPTGQKPKGGLETLKWVVKEAESPKRALRAASTAGDEAIVAAAVDIARMRHPSVAAILKNHGYGFEAEQVQKLVNAVDAAKGKPHYA